MNFDQPVADGVCYSRLIVRTRQGIMVGFIEGEQ